jgi:hypothetical protein
VNRRLAAGAIAAVVILGVTACSGEGADTAAPTAPSTSTPARATAETSPNPSATPSTSASSPADPANPANPANPPQPTTARTTGSPGSGPATTVPPPAPNAAYCQTMATIVDLTYDYIEYVLILGFSSDPAQIEQAWQDLKAVAEQIAALLHQAVGQTNHPVLQAYAQALAEPFEYIAVAATARDFAAVESIPEPDLPDAPGDYAPCADLFELFE